MKIFSITLMLIALTSITSCGTKANMPGQLLTNTIWQLQSINGTVVMPVANREPAQITFTTDNKVMGNSGCNNFSGSYNLNSEGGINISQLTATKMYCEGVDEPGFFGGLEKVTMTKVEKDKLTLIEGTKDVLVFVPKQ